MTSLMQFTRDVGHGQPRRLMPSALVDVIHLGVGLTSVLFVAKIHLKL